jgi:hypothetical protein
MSSDRLGERSLIALLYSGEQTGQNAHQWRHEALIIAFDTLTLMSLKRTIQARHQEFLHRRGGGSQAGQNAHQWRYRVGQTGQNAHQWRHRALKIAYPDPDVFKWKVDPIPPRRRRRGRSKRSPMEVWAVDKHVKMLINGGMDL